MEKSKAIEISNLNYHYKSEWTYRKKPALKDVNLTVNEGELFGFLGPNGAGKTTTIKCILGLIKPSSGSIKIFGEDWRKAESRRLVGYLPEQPYFYDHLTVQEIMQMYASLAGLKTPEISSHVKEALEKVKIGDRAKSKMRSLSKGLTQRVAMAQSIVAKPKLLILDEPFSGLDPIGRKELRDLIFELKEFGTTIFMSSHILSDVEHLCERASITARGELKSVFNISDLPASNHASFEIIIHSPENIESNFVSLCHSIQRQEKIVRLIFKDREKAMLALKQSTEMKLRIEEFKAQNTTLEDLFVSIVSGESTNHE